MKNSKNAKLILALAVAIALGAGGAGLYRLGAQHGMKVSTSGADRTPTVSGDDKKPLYWHDPMVPGQKFDKPGKSPFMDMQLVPVFGGAAGDEGKEVISPRVQQNLGVRTAEVSRGKLASSLVAVGSIAYNERDLTLVQARSNGFIEKLYVRAPLDPVKKGQPLAELYVPDWVAAQEEYLTARRLQSRGVDGVENAARQRMRQAGMDEVQIRLIESSGKVHPRVTLTAPVGGIVTELSAREGMTVMAGAPLFRINGISTVWVNAEIPESLAAQVRSGTPAEARTPALPGIVFKGNVGAILPEVNATTRTLKARIELGNPSGQLVPGMFATINFAQMESKDMLLVPTEAIIQTGTRSVVIVAQGNGRFLPAEVELGAESNGQTEIRKGLELGQKVVVSGQFLIDSEASLKGTTARMDDAPAADGAKAAGPIHHAQGKVERIDKSEVTISHGPVASLQWGPMTMGFKSPPAGLPRNVEVGDTVSFDFLQKKDGTFEIATISPTATASGPGKKEEPMNGMKMPSASTGAKR
ncbi:MAG: efflux RND transporter periplasmic adaptor subunit [Pseudomonadota bacterium]